MPPRFPDHCQNYAKQYDESKGPVEYLAKQRKGARLTAMEFSDDTLPPANRHSPPACLPTEMASSPQVFSEACETSLLILDPPARRPSFCYREELVQQHSGGVLHSALYLSATDLGFVRSSGANGSCLDAHPGMVAFCMARKN